MKCDYDILMVGCGLAAATYCALLKSTYKILVLDVRSHIGGNCYDYHDNGTFVHQYGPHIFHSPSQDVVDFLSNYTKWKPAEFQFEAEIDYNGLKVTPFPYSKITAKLLGEDLSPEDIIKLYFHGYSQKMWGCSWDNLPNTIKGRVPKNTIEKPEYFPGQFVGFPDKGYTRMIENMLDGVEVRLNVEPNEWKDIRAEKIIYMGRPDFLVPDISLDFRTLDMVFKSDPNHAGEAIRNICHMNVPYTRIICHRKLTGGNSTICSVETPRQALTDEIAPYYPMQFAGNPEKYAQIQEVVKRQFPNLILAGRLGTYKYLDMYQVVGQSIAFVKSHFNVTL